MKKDYDVKERRGDTIWYGRVHDGTRYADGMHRITWWRDDPWPGGEPLSQEECETIRREFNRRVFDGGGATNPHNYETIMRLLDTIEALR